MITKFEKGIAGEDLVANFMIDKGYKIISRREKNAFGEIDIIAHNSDDNCLVFIEIKVRDSYSNLHYELSPRQIHRIRECAQYFISLREEFILCDCRVDLAVISGGNIMNYIENILES